MSNLPRGHKHWNWKGGQKNNNGYVMIYFPDHPQCDSQGYIRQHRLVMEDHLDRLLSKDEIVHHINHIRNDNRTENLVILTKQEHDKIHLSSGIDTRFKAGGQPWNKGKIGVMPPPWNKGKTTLSTKVCITCDKKFSFKPSREKKHLVKYCSRKCYSLDSIPWNKGMHK